MCGSPALGLGKFAYGKDPQPGVAVEEDWGLLVKQRLLARKATPLADLLKAELITSPKSAQPICAESWALVGLLNQQPVKFGKLLLANKHGDSNLVAIEKIYGWDEKELSRQWRVYVMNLRKMKVPDKRN